MKLLREFVKSVLTESTSIDDEISFIRDWFKDHRDVFSGAFVVGSWANQDSRRMPDRNGDNSSDVDLMVVPVDRSYDLLLHAWDLAVRFEKEWNAKFTRKLHINVDEVIGNVKSIKVF